MKKKSVAKKQNNHNNNTSSFESNKFVQNSEDNDGVTSVYEDYLCMHTLKRKPADIRYINRVADELLQWYKNNPCVLRFDRFQQLKGVDDKTWGRWIERSPELKAASTYVRKSIGSYRDEKTTTGEHNVTWSKHIMHQYGPEWLAADKHHAGLKQPEANKPTTINVHMSNFGELDEQKVRSTQTMGTQDDGEVSE